MSTPEVPKFLSNWSTYNNFLKKQDSLLADLFTHYQGKKAKYEYERVLVGLLHRYALNFRIIYRSWPDFLANSKFKFSIYTLLRPLIADFLLMMYLLENFKWLVPSEAKETREEWQVNESDFIKRYENISTTFFERLDSYLRKKVKNTELSAQEMKDFLSHHKNIYPEFFYDGPELQIKKQKGLTPGQMADEIIYGKQFITNLYDYYFRLSQFEHFTMVTEGLMSDPDKDSELMYIVEITDCLLNGLNVNVSTIWVSDDFRNKTVELINGYRSTQWRIDSTLST
jgi:hypothetical protein